MNDQDTIRRFLFENMGVRGEWINLTSSWKVVTDKRAYPEVVQQQLGQALAAAALLSATIKFKGSLILQAQGEGPITAVVAQCTHDRTIRGLARSSTEVVSGALETMYGTGRLVMTIETDDAKPYQGIVQLAGQDLSQALENYYLQSEQLSTRIWLYANEFQVAGLLIQQLPSSQNVQFDWERIELLANTVTERELLGLPSEELLYRLFNEEQVRLFEPEPVVFRCSCSTRKIEQMLISLGRNTLEAILRERDHITVDCEFCNSQFSFDKVDIERILMSPVNIKIPRSQH